MLTCQAVFIAVWLPLRWFERTYLLKLHFYTIHCNNIITTPRNHVHMPCSQPTMCLKLK